MYYQYTYILEEQRFIHRTDTVGGYINIWTVINFAEPATH